MPLTILGQPPFATDEQGNLKCRIATLFVWSGTLVTLPGVHATQRLAYTDHLNRQRQEHGQPPLREDEEYQEWESAVDLIVEPNALLIRPDPAKMALAFEADALLQDLVSKRNIRFLYVRQEGVQQAIRQRGEYWRTSPRPETPEAMARVVATASIAIGGQAFYYYNAVTGVRYLTCQKFQALADLDDAGLRLHLAEIRDYATRINRRGHREVVLFAVDQTFGPQAFAGRDFEHAPIAQVRQWHAELADRFRQAVPVGLLEDTPDSLQWRNQMFACLIGSPDETVSEEILRGITPEFFRQIRWLPGGRVEHGELVFDSIFNERDLRPDDVALRELCDDRVKGFICNYMREFGGLEHINIGFLAPALRHRPSLDGHRAYIAEVKHRGQPEPVVRIIRLQKWGIREHLDAQKDLLWAILQAEDYTEFILDRRLGCWQLGMPLPGRIDTRRITEVYQGAHSAYRGTRIWTTCFERDFIEGVATDKIPLARYRDERFATAVARLLGEAAASNLIVGRTTLDGTVIFDNGDEVLIFGTDGSPRRIVVADHAGTFTDCTSELASFAAAYARPIALRAARVPVPAAFANAYLDAFATRFGQIRDEYRRQRRAFDVLFQHSKQGTGTFAWRWAKVLTRLDRTDPLDLTRAIRNQLP